jgi:hypothetical protein
MLPVRPEMPHFVQAGGFRNMATPTQNQNQNQNQNKSPQGQQNQAQGRKDDMHNTGAQAKDQNAGKDADRDVQQRKDAPKQDQNH